ncbi:hypothetical protein PRK78_003329 [Emydomyces testavorans]|uniref:Uncharacterized protein n=1 Tax=Emydomyces testavorans TaxID=2070801 RepID=A0AAF0DHX6_9EURO|nr:hypothetical protein PRK78_003329 [Emydomyces testavorans]
MRVASLILGLAAICSPAAAIRTCGAKPPQAFLDASTVLYSKLEGSQPVADGPVEVRAFFHVVTKGPKVQDGNLTEETMRKQFDVLQKEFARYSIQFQLANTTRTINTDWAAGKDELGMKEALRQGSYADLNFYFLPNMGDLLGVSLRLYALNKTLEAN